MSEFASLEAALEGHFDKALADLPERLRMHAGMCAPAKGQLDRRAFTVWNWDTLSADHRRQVARQWDCLNDPTQEQDAQRLWDLYVEKSDLERKIIEWELMPANIPTELVTKENRVAELQRDLAAAKERLAGVIPPSEPASSVSSAAHRTGTTADKADFRSWAEEHRLVHGTYPSRNQAYKDFAKSRGLSRDWSRIEIATLPLEHRHGSGAPRGKRSRP